jgi:hypothetical protein
MLSMRILLPVLLLSIWLGCGTARHTVRADAPQQWFRITLGRGDTEPTDWSGSIQVAGGRLADMHPVRFDKDDKLDAPAASWTCHTRRTAVADPRDWFVGAKHIVPTNPTPVKGAVVAGAFDAAIESGNEVRVKTAQGEFRFAPADVRFGAPVAFLGGRVEVERAAQPSNLTAGDGFEDDEPALALDASGRAWVAWLAYRAENEALTVARGDGSGRQSIARGEFFRPALAGGYLAVSMRAGDTWKIAVSQLHGDRWSAPEPISGGGPDLFPCAAIDSAGHLWVAWQGFRDGRSRILSRRFDGKSWGPETAVSDNTGDAWMPAIASGPNGSMHFAWDAYDRGVFNVYYRAAGGPMRRVLSSARFQANASVAVDGTGAVWLAWDEAGPNWGKDTGFLVRGAHGTALYEDRSSRIVKLDDSGVVAPPALPAGAEQPKLLADGSGLYLLMRRRNLKMQAVFSPSLQRDRVQQQSLWDYAVATLGAGGWSVPAPLPLSNGRNDTRAAFTIASGRILAAWNGDGRTFATPYPYVKNDILTAEIADLKRTGAPAVSKIIEEPTDAAPVHSDEAAQVAKIRAHRISAGGKSLYVLRGDMHRHTDISFDGDLDGGILEFYRYMIDAANMDYGALTDHHAGDNKEFFWWILQKHAKMFYYPGRFTPLFAYERSLRFPNGHRNLIWSKEGVHALPTTDAEEAGKEGAGRLYAYLRQSNGLAMSHTSATLMGTDWRDNDPQLEPLVEIYQGDRTSAEYEGAPRAPRGSDPYSQPGGYKAEGFVWNAWAKGYKLGVQSSSDHASTHISYAVVLAEDRTREGILKAIAARHAYAATDNLLLDVRSGAHLQGDIFAATGKPRLEIHIEGTGPVDRVEVIRNNQFVFSDRPGKASVELRYEDNDPKPGESYYYVRVEQRNGQMAWSSPVWVKR